jgi:hypothetical protein
MKHIQRFNNFVRVNEEFIGLGMVALAGLSLAGVLMYKEAKRMWSKHIAATKYIPTGKIEKVENQITGKEETISEYKDKEGKLYYGYDHMWNPNPNEWTIDCGDLYRAIYKAEDKIKLERFLKGVKHTIGYDSDSTKRPDPVDMLYLKDYEEIRKEYAPRYKEIVRGTIG